jgi:hypothetical protein
VTEHHGKDNSLLGAPLVSGYQSHFVCTTATGEIPQAPFRGALFDEIVIPQENQVSPLLRIPLPPPPSPTPCGWPPICFFWPVIWLLFRRSVIHPGFFGLPLSLLALPSEIFVFF